MNLDHLFLVGLEGDRQYCRDFEPDRNGKINPSSD